jgi:hypothetical protein
MDTIKIPRSVAKAALEALIENTPPMPGPQAMCHSGIVLQYRCCHCNRVKAAHEAMATLTAALSKED